MNRPSSCPRPSRQTELDFIKHKSSQAGHITNILIILIGTKAEEDRSFEQSQILVTVFTIFMIVISMMEILMYFIYNRKVSIKYLIWKICDFNDVQFHPWIKIVQNNTNHENKEGTITDDIEENTDESMPQISCLISFLLYQYKRCICLYILQFSTVPPGKFVNAFPEPWVPEAEVSPTK